MTPSSHSTYLLRTALSAVTLLCAWSAGKIFQFANIPAPFLLGSLFALWILARTLASTFAKNPIGKTQLRLIVPRTLYIAVVSGLAVLIGSAFSPHLFAQAKTWLVSLAAMLAATVLATTLATLFLTKVRNYPTKLAFLCSIPGGQAEVLLVSQRLVQKDYVVALCHLMRVLVVFCATPLLLTLIDNESLATATTLATLPKAQAISETSLTSLSLFTLFAAAGYAGAKAARIPVPYLLGPLAISLAVHLSGIAAVPRIEEFMTLAQITIGGTLGLKLAQVRFRKLVPYALDAVVSTTLVLTVYGSTAALLASWTQTSFWQMFLAFIPGGLNEVSLLAFLFGYDVAFIAFHHTTRLLIIIGTISLISKDVAKSQLS